VANFDVVVVGAGVLGLCTATELARTGRRTLLVERGEEIAGETSAAWFRILHGGLRYLQRLDVVRHRKSIKARAHWLRCYPDLVQPLACLMPLYGRGLKRPWPLRAAFALDALLASDRNAGVIAAHRLPAGHVLDVAATRTRYPAVPGAGLQGAALWHDAVVRDDRALVRALADEAAAGAEIRTSTTVDRLVVESNRVRKLIGADGWTAGAAAVINTAGPWSRELAARFDRDLPHLFRPSLAFNLLLDRPAPIDGGLAVQASRPDAPVLFVYPLDGVAYCGTWHLPWSMPAGRPEPDAAAIEAFLADLNDAIPELAATPGHVRRVFAGLLPASRSGGVDLTDRPVLVDHAAHGGPTGLISAVDVKFTTAPVLAGRIVRMLDRREGLNPRRAQRTAMATAGGTTESAPDDSGPPVKSRPVKPSPAKLRPPGTATPAKAPARGTRRPF
jgi:glycerol-3-phosphate dehydrogenase